MKIASGDHKCINLTEVSEITEFMLDKALKRNGVDTRFHLLAGLNKRITQYEKKDEELETHYQLDGRTILKTSISVVNPHKGCMLLHYWIMDWS